MLRNMRLRAQKQVFSVAGTFFPDFRVQSYEKFPIFALDFNIN